MLNRRRFIQASAFTGLATVLGKDLYAGQKTLTGKPVVISTWPNIKANTAAWELLGKGSRAFDAVIKGVQVPESDPGDTSVGYGGLPDRDGNVTLDSCVMDEFGNCGAVMALEHIMHPVLVARLVMEKTPHVQLVGEGALQFALSQGFARENLLTPSSEKMWREWLKTSKYSTADTLKGFDKTLQKKDERPYPWPVPDLNHDTIGMVAFDSQGNLGGACTTSGMAYKLHGRVGDSPIIGAGLFVDNEVGAATATGVGEEVVKICGSHTIIEAMRHGMTPDEACKEAVRRIVRNNKNKNLKDLQVGFLALDKQGNHGGFAIQKGFSYCMTNADTTTVIDVKSWF